MSIPDILLFMHLHILHYSSFSQDSLSSKSLNRHKLDINGLTFLNIRFIHLYKIKRNLFDNILLLIKNY